MSHRPTMYQSPEIAKLVERQLRNVELLRTTEPHSETHATRPPVRDFVAISRQVASGGRRIACLVAERLGWPVFDAQILQHMAGDDEVRRELYAHLDERDQTWIADMLGWLVQGELRQHDYFHRLTQTVLALARQSSGVFVGRGADLILPRQIGLRVRIVAPAELRLRFYIEQTGLDPKQARVEMNRLEEQRIAFVKHHFRRDPEDATRYDLTLCLEHYSPEQAVDIIFAAMKARGGAR
ncbi:MAG: AAA family ATPase [Phycisphaerae bacterium]